MASENQPMNPENTDGNSPSETLPVATRELIDTLEINSNALEPDFEGNVDIMSVVKLVGTANALAPYQKIIDTDTEYKHRALAVTNQLRKIPATILDPVVSEDSRDFLRMQYEHLPHITLDRVTDVNFPSYHAIRMFPAEIVHADFSDEFTERTLNQMKFNLYFSSYEMDKVFDIYQMDQEKEPSEEEEDGELMTEGDEQKAMRYVLTRTMLPMDARFYDQVAGAVQKFLEADYDVSKMDDGVLNALALIDSLGQVDHEIYDEMLKDFDIQFDGRDWRTIVEQLKQLDSTSDKWKQLLVDVDKMNKENSRKQTAEQPAELRVEKLIIEIDEMIAAIEENHMDEDGAGNRELKPLSEWDDPYNHDYQMRRRLSAIRADLDTMFKKLKYQSDKPEHQLISNEEVETGMLDAMIRLSGLDEELAASEAEQKLADDTQPERRKRRVRSLMKSVTTLYDRTRAHAERMNDQQLVEYLAANAGVKRQDMFLDHMHVAVTEHGVDSLRPNQRKGIEETAAADKHFGRKFRRDDASE